MKSIRQIARPAKFKDGLLNPYGPTRYRVIDLPGWEGQRRPLTFVLKVLWGVDDKLIHDHVECLLSFDFQYQTAENEEIYKIFSQHPDMIQFATRALIGTMREMADIWIDSGKLSSNGEVDSPAGRNVEDVVPGHSVSLHWMMNRLLFDKHPQYVGMRRDGSQEIRDVAPRFKFEDLEDGLEAALANFGKSLAAYYFAVLLDSPFARHISRCDRCLKYFAYRRARLRIVKNGVFCPDCEAKGSLRRTQISRGRRLDTAAQAVIDWEAKSRHTELSDWIWQRVNQAHGTAFGPRWVSQNMPRIRERVEALRNAKR